VVNDKYERDDGIIVEKMKVNWLTSVDGDMGLRKVTGDKLADLDASALQNDLVQAIAQYPKKIIVVAYDSGIKVNLSVRGKGVKDLISKAIEGFENATSGGHEDAVGGRIRAEDLNKLIRKLT
ncbi:hypothetical protein LCGC14_1297340, partial [marine sediment metagenome]